MKTINSYTDLLNRIWEMENERRFFIESFLFEKGIIESGCFRDSHYDEVKEVYPDVTIENMWDLFILLSDRKLVYEKAEFEKDQALQENSCIAA